MSNEFTLIKKKAKINFFNYKKNLYKNQLKKEQLVLYNFYKFNIELIENYKKRNYSFIGELLFIKRRENIIESLSVQCFFGNIKCKFNIPIQIIKNILKNNKIIYQKNN